MQTIWKDLSYGVRMLLKKPGFTLIAILTLGVGIGANSAIFSLVNTALLRPLPVKDPARLVSVNATNVSGEQSIPVLSYPNFRDFRDRNDVFEGVFAYRFAPVALSNKGVNERIWGYLVSGNYFDVLGVQPLLGRFISPEDDIGAGAHPVVVLTYDCWRKRFGGDPQTIGKTVIVNGRAFTVIGVAGQEFKGSEIGYRPEVWFPASMQEQIEARAYYLEDRDEYNFFIQGRLKPGVTIEQAEERMKTIAAQLAKEYPKENEGLTIELSPAGLFGSFLRGPVKGFSFALMAVVGMVLLLACTNIANLLLARASERRKEIAVRLAIGARRGRLIRQLLTESLMLSMVGGAFGLTLAYWLVDAMMALKPPIDIPIATDLHLDWRVLLFTFLISALTGLLFGLLPAAQATKPDLIPALKDEVSFSGARRSWLRHGLIVMQISLSLILLICAALVFRGMQGAQELNPGFNPKNAVAYSFDLSLQGYDGPRSREFKRQLLDRVRSLPGVESVGLSNYLPLSLNMNTSGVLIEGQPLQRGVTAPTSMRADISYGYLAAMGTKLMQGREFTEQEILENRSLALVNNHFAQRFWPGQSAIGKRYRQSEDGPWIEIIGVVEDGKYFSLAEEPKLFSFTTLGAEAGGFLTLIARSSVDPVQLVGPIRREFQRLDDALPVYDVKTMTDHMALPLFPARVAASLLSGFGLLALFLASIGVYGVMSYAVTQRTREIGVRMALGAQSASILRLIIGQGIRLTIIGAAIGLAGAFAGTRFLRSLLYGVSAIDLVAFGGASLLLMLVAFFACYLPARRAMNVDPMVALRAE